MVFTPGLKRKVVLILTPGIKKMNKYPTAEALSVIERDFLRNSFFWANFRSYLDTQINSEGTKLECSFDYCHSFIKVLGDLYLAQFDVISAAWSEHPSLRGYHRIPESLFSEILDSVEDHSTSQLQFPDRRDLILQVGWSDLYLENVNPRVESAFLRWFPTTKEYFWVPIVWSERFSEHLKSSWVRLQQAHSRLQDFLCEDGTLLF